MIKDNTFNPTYSAKTLDSTWTTFQRYVGRVSYTCFSIELAIFRARRWQGKKNRRKMAPPRLIIIYSRVKNFPTRKTARGSKNGGKLARKRERHVKNEYCHVQTSCFAPSFEPSVYVNTAENVADDFETEYFKNGTVVKIFFNLRKIWFFWCR